MENIIVLISLFYALFFLIAIFFIMRRMDTTYNNPAYLVRKIAEKEEELKILNNITDKSEAVYHEILMVELDLSELNNYLIKLK